MRASCLALLPSLLVLIALLAHPTPARACTGCPESVAEVVRDADRVIVATVVGVSPTAGYRFEVERIVKGNAPPIVELTPGGQRDYPLGSRWILLLFPGHGLDTANTWQVETDGTLVVPGPFDAPSTLAAFIALVEAPATDAARDDPPRSLDPGRMLLLAAALVAGWWLGLWRSSRPASG